MHRLRDEVLEEAPQAARVEVPEVIGVVDLAEDAEIERQRLDAGRLAAIAPAVVGVAEDARQQHGDHLVAQAQPGEPLDDLGAGDVLEQPPVLIELRLGIGGIWIAGELALARPQHVAAGAARHRQHHPDVMDEEQRQVHAHPRSASSPTRRADDRHRGIGLHVRQHHRRDLAREVAATTFCRDRHRRN